MAIGATDQSRSLFLKGFRLSKQGNYEDPTYLGFKFEQYKLSKKEKHITKEKL